MGKRQAQQKQIEIDDTDDGTEAIDMLAVAAHTAKELFGEASAAAVFGTYDCMAVDAESDEEAVEDLKKAYAVAKELFEVEKPTAEMTFGVFERVFLNTD